MYETITDRVLSKLRFFSEQISYSFNIQKQSAGNVHEELASDNKYAPRPFFQ